MCDATEDLSVILKEYFTLSHCLCCQAQQSSSVAHAATKFVAILSPSLATVAEHCSDTADVTAPHVPEYRFCESCDHRQREEREMLCKQLLECLKTGLLNAVEGLAVNVRVID